MLSRELLKILPQPYFYYSSDQLVSAGVLPNVDRKTNDTPWSWNVIRPRFFDGFHRSIAALAAADNLLLVEHIVEFKRWLDDLVLLLSPYRVMYIGVHCPVEEMERREIARGDRYIGEAKSHLEDGIHTWSEYDLTVNTFTATPQENAKTILKALPAYQHGQSIFKQLSKSKIN